MQIRKFLPMECDVIVVDGMWGVGKTAVTSVIGCMNDVEKVKLDLIHEFACVLNSLGKMSDEAARFLLLTYADINQYHNLIGREINFRPSDATGTKNTPGSTLRYLRRMFAGDGDGIVTRIHRDHIAHQVVTHQILPVGEPMFSAFGDRLKMLHIVRHPMHLARYYHDYFVDWMRHREFTVSLDFEGEKIPWWAIDWAEQFLRLNTMDRALESLTFLYKRIFDQIERRRDDPRLLVLSFENIVMRPHESFPAISSFLGRDPSKKTSKILAREKIPRPTITHGRAFSAHNWATKGAVSERDVYELEASYIHSSASPDVVERFRGVVDTYNNLWPSELNEFAELL